MNSLWKCISYSGTEMIQLLLEHLSPRAHPGKGPVLQSPSLQTAPAAEAIGKKTTDGGFVRSPATHTCIVRKGQLFPFLFKSTTIHYVNIKEGGNGERQSHPRVDLQSSIILAGTQPGQAGLADNKMHT